MMLHIIRHRNTKLQNRIATNKSDRISLMISNVLFNIFICNSHSRIKKGENLLTVSHGHRANKLLEGDSGMVSEQQDNEGRSLISSAGAGINDEQNSNYHMNEISKILCGFAQNLLSSFVEAFDAKAMEGLKRSSSFNKTKHFVMEGVKFICSTNKSFENANVNFLTDFLVKNIHKEWILSSGDILTTRNLSLKTCKNEATKSLLFGGGRHQLLTIKMQELQEHIHSLIGGKKETFYQSNGVLKRNFIKPDENFDSNRQKRQAIPRESFLNVLLVIYLTAFYILVHVINWFLDHEPNLPAGYQLDVFIFYLCFMASLINEDPYLRRHAKNVLAHLVAFVVNEPAQEFRHVAPPLYNQQQMPIHARELASAQRHHQTQRSNEASSSGSQFTAINESGNEDSENSHDAIEAQLRSRFNRLLNNRDGSTTSSDKESEKNKNGGGKGKKTE